MSQLGLQIIIVVAFGATRRIAANIAKPAGVIVSASKGARAESGYPRSYPTDFDRDT